jgi:hypothetical protein
MDKFRVGQRVIKINSKGVAPKGTIGTITEQRSYYIGTTNKRKIFGYTTDTKLEGGTIWSPEEDAIKLFYDGDEKSSWEECEWKPDSHRVQIKVGEEGIEAKGYTGESFPA